MKEQITVVIIDDQQDSQNVLQSLLRFHEQFVVVGVANNAEQGLKEILEKLPDVVFLDVEMPGQSGLEMYDELKRSGYVTNVVFTTGLGDYAIEALRQHAFDYLLKPINPDEFDACLTRLRISHKTANNDAEKLPETRWTPARIKFNTRSGFVLVDPNEIVYCVADGNYTIIHCGAQEKLMVSLQLGKIAELIPGEIHVRVGRSYIIGMNYIKEVDRKKQCCVFVKNGELIEVTMSVQYIQKLSDAMDERF